MTSWFTPVCEGRHRRPRNRPGPVFGMTLIGLGLIGATVLLPMTRVLVWNSSASAPTGLYRVAFTPFRRGDLVLVHVPENVRKLAAARGYIPAEIPLIKRVAAMKDDEVCALNDRISINKRVVALRLRHDRLGRPMPIWTGCFVLESDEIFLLNAAVSDSFDGRYFGPVSTSLVIGKLVSVWTG